MAAILISKLSFQPSSGCNRHRWLTEVLVVAASAVVAVGAWSWSKTTSSTFLPSPKLATPLVLDKIFPNMSGKTHLVVLVHGWMGNPLEMNYLQQALEKGLEEQQQIRDTSASTTTNSNLIVYSAKCNEGRTSDGIEAGGRRLAAEINELLRQLRDQWTQSTTTSPPPFSLSLSLVGNSLGGLYARHAISLLDWDLVDEPLAFVTTATPHLGVGSPHAYVPLPRALEWVVANVLHQTGRDLFLRQSHIVEQMATDETYLMPLRRFKRRIAYANTFATDFQVPTATAGFLSPTSTSPHTIIKWKSTLSSSSSSEDEDSFVVAVVDTHSTNNNQRQPASQIGKRDYQTMVENLDALGWTKVFCDVRESLPAVPLSFSIRQQQPLLLPPGARSRTAGTSTTVASLATSRELHKRLTQPDSTKWHFPGGHTILVANSKNEVSANLNQWGRPIMDRLARDIHQCFFENQYQQG